MYSYYLDHLKSLKKFVADVFPAITHYQFNYGNYSLVNYKLYKEHVVEYPMCIINLTDITNEDNQAFKRYIGNKHSLQTAQLLASNHTKKDSIVMDFKWMVLQVQIKINFASAADLLNYNNVFQSYFPKNFMFYSYAYKSLINIDNYTKNWEPTDTTEGLVYRVVEQNIEAFAEYEIEPLFRINSIVQNKDIKSGISLDVNIEVKLKVPNKIGNITIDDRLVNGIEIVINDMQKETPFLIDMNNDIFNNVKIKRRYILTPDLLIGNTLELDYTTYNSLLNHSLGVYLVDDSTSPEPNISWTELFLTDQNIVIKQPFVAATSTTPEIAEIKVFRIQIDDNIQTYTFNTLSNLQLLVF